MTDLESRIWRVIIGTRVQADQPDAILAEIGTTHVLVERERWERVTAPARFHQAVLNCLSDSTLSFAESELCNDNAWDDIRSSLNRIQPGDLDPIGPDAAVQP